MLKIDKYSLGLEAGSGQHARAQLRAFQQLAQSGPEVAPVLSLRDHASAQNVFDAANAAVDELNWELAWHVDADGVRPGTAELFVPAADFFTIDVAPEIGQPTERKDVERFVIRHPELIGTHAIKGLSQPFVLSDSELQRVAAKFLPAVRAAAQLAKLIGKRKGRGKFIASVSLDAAEAPQTPAEILVLLALLADLQVRVQVLAPKFPEIPAGDVEGFAREFSDRLAVLLHGVAMYSLPKSLKLCLRLHAAQASFYPAVREALARTGAGLHVQLSGIGEITEPEAITENLHTQHLRPLFGGKA